MSLSQLLRAEKEILGFIADRLLKTVKALSRSKSQKEMLGMSTEETKNMIMLLCTSWSAESLKVMSASGYYSEEHKETLVSEERTSTMIRSRR